VTKPVIRITLRITEATADAIRERMPAVGAGTLSGYVRGLIADDLDGAPAFAVNKNGRPKGRRPTAAERTPAQLHLTAQAASAAPAATVGPPVPPPPAAPAWTPEPSPPPELCPYCRLLGRPSCPDCTARAARVRGPG
jgi:hypothetical protein